MGLKLSLSNDLHILNKDFTRFLKSTFLSCRVKKGSTGRVEGRKREFNLNSLGY